ncbi:MAG: cytochrome c oxidase assembly factor Coa1 family protein [Thermoanaerobaculia bacterium]|nr:cytochrome c oxidase assembly factor Coa1 family protein [Thermoanaerobaculia bacterium]
MTSVPLHETYPKPVRRRLPVAVIVLVAAIAIFALSAAMSDTRLINSVSVIAMDQTLRDERVAARLGEPLVAGRPSGKVAARRDRIDVEVVMPIEGSRSRARLHATAVVVDGATRLTSVTLASGVDRMELTIDAGSQR